MQGELLPYLPKNDWLITTILILSFIMMAWAVKNGRMYLINHLKNFFVHKERGSLFDASSSISSEYLVAPALVTCIMTGIYIFCNQTAKNPSLLTHIPREILLSTYILSAVILIFFKWIAYSIVNWIFFDKKQRDTWIEAFLDLIILSSFILFPFILIYVFFNFSPIINVTIMAFFLIICKLLLFYKCMRNFYAHYYGIIHIILYFCALEIIPDFLMYKWVYILNNILTINF